MAAKRDPKSPLPQPCSKKQKIDKSRQYDNTKGYFYIFTVKPIRVPLVNRNNEKLSRSMTLQESAKYMSKENYELVEGMLSEKMDMFLFGCKDEGEFVNRKNVVMPIYLYRFKGSRRFSDANRYKCFEISLTLPMPPLSATPLNVFDLVHVLQVDEREECMIDLERARTLLAEAKMPEWMVEMINPPEPVMEELQSRVLLRENNVKDMESKLQLSSINPNPESSLRDLFYNVLVSKNTGIWVKKEYSVDESYTVFQGWLDMVLVQTTGTAAPPFLVVNVVVEREEEGREENEEDTETSVCAGVETKRYLQQSTQQALAGCHGLLATSVARALPNSVIGKATAFAFELRRGANRLHPLEVDFHANSSRVLTFPEAVRLCDATTLINYMIAKLTNPLSR